MNSSKNIGFDHLFATRVELWTMLRRIYHSCFDQREIDALSRQERKLVPSKRKVVFLSFENRLAALGGLAAVTRLLPAKMQSCGEKIIIITPFHKNNRKIKSALKAGILEPVLSGVDLKLCKYRGKASCYQDKSSQIPTYFIDVNRCFTATEDPYQYADNSRLLHDALVFSAAVPLILSRLGYKKNIIFHANDWETAPVAITSRLAMLSHVIESSRTVLTLHNSFDCGISSNKKAIFFGKYFPGHTVLQCTIPFLNGPLTTVSTPFAYELRYDPLQHSVFTNHLQKFFSMNPPLGIENGMFGHSVNPFSSAAVKSASLARFPMFIQEKREHRRELEQFVNDEKREEIIGSLKFKNNSPHVPLFFMSGRLDLMQKGFDVIFHAFCRLPRGSAKLLFSPSSANNGYNSSLEFFSKFVEKCRGDIAIWPFRIKTEQYRRVLLGSSFLLMPSFYEPFGAATEGFLHGTPVIARATGGLWVQVNPYGSIKVPSFYKSLFQFSGSIEEATGVLYREKCDDQISAKYWKKCLELSPERRIRNKVFSEMVSAAANALKTACGIYSNDKAYGRMIFNGLNTVERFSWERAVEKYRQIYDAASFRGGV